MNFRSKQTHRNQPEGSNPASNSANHCNMVSPPYRWLGCGGKSGNQDKQRYRFKLKTENAVQWVKKATFSLERLMDFLQISVKNKKKKKNKEGEKSPSIHNSINTNPEKKINPNT